MKAVGIISEYNPFHYGHKYQLEQAKALAGADAVVCVMSGSVVQRGEVAVFDKWARAKAALEGGADLVLELPAWYVLQSAQMFAWGGVEILKKSHLADALSFGSESADIESLKLCAKILANEPLELKENIDKLLKTGMGYPQAFQSSFETLYPEYAYILKNPNDMLGANYIAAAIRAGVDFDIFPVKRVGADHRSLKTDGIYASSTSIRIEMEKGVDISSLTPIEHAPLYKTENLENFILGFYRTADADRLKNIPGIEDGFENRLISCAKESAALDEFYSSLSGKRYTLSRVKRIVMAGLLGLDKERECDYIRVLGMTDTGAELLKRAKNKTEVPFVVKTADFSPSQNSTFKFDIAATDIAALSCGDVNFKKAGADFFNSPIKI